MPGSRAAIRSSASPGPSGLTRSCSQFSPDVDPLEEYDVEHRDVERRFRTPWFAAFLAAFLGSQLNRTPMLRSQRSMIKPGRTAAQSKNTS